MNQEYEILEQAKCYIGAIQTYTIPSGYFILCENGGYRFLTEQRKESKMSYPLTSHHIDQWLKDGIIRPIEAKVEPCNEPWYLKIDKRTPPPPIINVEPVADNPLSGLSLADLFELTKMWMNDDKMSKDESDKFANAIAAQRMKIYNELKQATLKNK